MSLHTPDGLNYECVQCGKSCRMFNEIFVEPRSEAVLESLDYRPLMAPEVRDLSPLVPGESDKSKKRLRKHDGSCVFHTAEGLCRVHGAFGFEQKPQTCRDFPIRYANTPDGIYIGLSFACTAVLGNMGPTMESRRAELEASAPVANSRRDLTRPVRLTARHEVSWEAYRLVEEDLVAIIALKGQPLGSRLVAQSIYLDLLVAFLREVRGDSIHRRDQRFASQYSDTGRFPPDCGPAPDAEVVMTMRRQYLSRPDAASLMRLAAKRRPSPMLHRAFLGLVTAFRQGVDSGTQAPTRWATIARIFRHYSAHALRLGRVDLASLGGRFDYADFKRIPFRQDDPATAELLDRFFAHTLFRKDLLAAESVWLAQRFSLMHFALIRWHAVGHAAITARAATDAECASEAIRAVELHYLTHTHFGQLFEKFPSLGMVLDSVVRKPLYAPSMVGAPV